MKKQLRAKLLSLCLIVCSTAASAQTTPPDPAYRRHFIGSSLFMLANLFPNSASFYKLNYGYRITPKNVISVEAITWKYQAPLGIPYGPSYQKREEEYPGSVKSAGIGVAYQRFLWKKFYSALHATSFLQTYRNEKKEKIQNGFQLFCTLRAGYHLQLFENRFFLEPSIACTYWPVNTNLPPSFATKENKWPNYFLFEPGFNFGVKF
jgi:hypothetical protein